VPTWYRAHSDPVVGPTLWLATDLLREPDTTIGTVAWQVGHRSVFALSAAFKRAHETSPNSTAPGRDKTPLRSSRPRSIMAVVAREAEAAR
jgi:AraC-like DNA-binding protein